MPSASRSIPTTLAENPPGRGLGRTVAVKIVLQGRVQGVGMRPQIACIARELGLAGHVANTHHGVEVQLEGPARVVTSFLPTLLSRLPPHATVDDVRCLNVEPRGDRDFDIVGSSNAQELAALVPADRATCPRCLAESRAPADRRAKYPFTSCTDCGPRYSLIRAMPYDRSATSMSAFAVCSACRQEYQTAGDRRFHSQINACHHCGPTVWLNDRAGGRLADGVAAIELAVQAILRGEIVAIKGVGGYQLLADATSPAAVERLRQKKHRASKPLAVLVESLDYAMRFARIDDDERAALADSSNPILLLERRGDTVLAENVCAGLSTVGVLLPTTPLHDRLVRTCGRPLVVTSGNDDSNPLAFEVDAAQRELAGIAEVVLHHDRNIVRPIDDSVVRVIAGRRATVRLARGLAPLPLELDSTVPILALGAHQKVALALSNGRQAILGPHLGDLDSTSTRARWVQQIESLCDLYRVAPACVVHDSHPDYFTTRWAQAQRMQQLAVQHHHAHVAAAMLEQGWLNRTVLGVAWDGTGWGTDGTIWGGEFLRATTTGFERVAHLRQFALPGGEQAIHEPWRIAVSLVHQAAGDDAIQGLRFPGVNESQLDVMASIVDRPRVSPLTSSAGRLFDGAAALILAAAKVDYEGQAAMLLESATDRNETGAYPLELLVCNKMIEIDWRPLVRAILNDRKRGVPPGAMAMRFHRAFAAAMCAVAAQFASLPVVLCGGVFQNRLLTELVAEQFAQSSQSLGLPGMIPVSDGGLAAGQLAIAAALLKQEGVNSCA